MTWCSIADKTKLLVEPQSLEPEMKVRSMWTCGPIYVNYQGVHTSIAKNHFCLIVCRVMKPSSRTTGESSTSPACQATGANRNCGGTLGTYTECSSNTCICKSGTPIPDTTGNTIGNYPCR